jgi:hypothetical protein
MAKDSPATQPHDAPKRNIKGAVGKQHRFRLPTNLVEHIKREEQAKKKRHPLPLGPNVTLINSGRGSRQQHRQENKRPSNLQRPRRTTTILVVRA